MQYWAHLQRTYSTALFYSLIKTRYEAINSEDNFMVPHLSASSTLKSRWCNCTAITVDWFGLLHVFYSFIDCRVRVCVCMCARARRRRTCWLSPRMQLTCRRLCSWFWRQRFRSVELEWTTTVPMTSSSAEFGWHVCRCGPCWYRRRTASWCWVWNATWPLYTRLFIRFSRTLLLLINP